MANAIPTGTTVPSQGLDVVNGVACMELNAVMPAIEGMRANLARELIRILIQVTDVSQVSVSLSGDVLNAQGIPVPPTHSLDTLMEAGPDGVGIVLSSGLTGLTSTTSTSDPTVSPVDSSLAVWSDTDGVYAHHGGTSVAFLPGQAPLGPSVNRFEQVWDSAATLSVGVGGGVGGMFNVSVESESTGEIYVVRISPDGTHAPVPRGSDVSTWIDIVERDASGRPLTIRSFEWIPLEHDSVVNASWTTSTDLMFVMRTTGGDNQLVILPLGGLSSNVSPPIRVASMSVGGSSSVVVTSGTDADGKAQVLIYLGAL